MPHGDEQRRGGELGLDETRFDEQVAEAVADQHGAVGLDTPAADFKPVHGLTSAPNKQTVAISNGSSTEQFRLKFAGKATETAPLAHDAAAAVVEAALQDVLDVEYPGLTCDVTLSETTYTVTIDGSTSELEEGAQVGTDTVTVTVAVVSTYGAYIVDGDRDDPEQALKNLLVALEALGVIVDDTMETT